METNSFTQNNVLMLIVDTPILPKVIRSFPIDENIIKEITANGDPFIFVTYQEKDAQFKKIGCLCTILNYDVKSEDNCRITLEGVAPARVNITEMREGNTLFHCTIESLSSNNKPELQIKLGYAEFLKKWKKIAGKVKISYLPELNNAVMNDSKNGPYIVVDLLNEDNEIKQRMLETADDLQRIDFINEVVARYDYDTKIEDELNKRVREAMERNQVEYFLREKMKAVKDMLKTYDGSIDTDEKYEKMLLTNKYPPKIKTKIENELSRLKTMPSGSQDGTISRTYIDLIANLPWFSMSQDNDDLKDVSRILDEDHYGLEKQKDRILEYLAVKQMTNSLKAPILCLYGPPGVGKTSLAISIARALNRKFVKASLGGMHDESEIRGHRRTYIGAMPGKIIQNVKKSGVRNPVFLLDEIDKVKSSAFHGDPSAALLEVLDPEQNFEFSDNYLEEPFDLSQVLFICTANNLNEISSALRDRLELIELNSYTVEEKLQIGKKYLCQAELAANGLDSTMISFSDDGLRYLIEYYTREAGVRELRRKIATVMRKFAVKMLKGDGPKTVEVNREQIEDYLGKPIFDHTKSTKKDNVGIVTGLAYTDYGGEVLPIEVNYFKGSGKVVKTGNLGDIMKESAEIALGYIKANVAKFKIADDFFDKHDINIHVPQGATPKDGPSAGIALTLAILSAITGIKVKSNVAMTGEVDLRGNAMAIGGLREKTLAACRENIKLVLAPQENHKDISELPKEVTKNIEIKQISSVEEAIGYAFVESPLVLND